MGLLEHLRMVFFIGFLDEWVRITIRKRHQFGAKDFVKNGNLKVGRKAAKKMTNNYPPRSLTASLYL